MAEHADKTSAPAGADTAQANAGLQDGGDHDRVVMLTLNPDGTPRQHNPEIIGDKDFAVAAARRQFSEQAVSAVDTQLRGVTSGDVGERDPDKLRPAHEDAQAAAHDRAEATVDALHQGLGD
jgi:hypothetical protein